MYRFFILLVVLQLALDLFFLWRIISFDAYRLKLNATLGRFSEKLKKLYQFKSIPTAGLEVCSACLEPLPEDALKTHDGQWLCSVCKPFSSSVKKAQK